MQDLHSIESSGGGGGGRSFAGAGNRQLRPHHHNDLKCPRCDSSNTKFCYYNNYNLSQPRHFCKSCRRYWTNGGVLRNVPVGGGVRKAKRSGKPKSKTNLSSSSSSAFASDPSDLERKSTNSENSSSDSCSRTATATPITTAEVSGSNSTNSTPPMLLNFNESSTQLFNIPQSSASIATVDPVILNQSCGGNMSSEMRTFTGLMRSWTDELPLGIEKTENQMQRDVKMAEDWEDNVDHEGLFDQSYWSQSQWNDDHHHLLNYLP